MKQLAKVLVGSRLHGLDTPTSDYDYRGIHIHDLADVLSPFKTLKDTSWIEGDEDNTSYELRDFCKLAVHGNATILEVFFSDAIHETSSVHQDMRDNWIKFMDTKKFIDASLGYARNNKNKFEERNPVGVRGQYRRHKFAVAYARVLWQCLEFLKTGEFKCRIDEGEFKDKLLRWKNSWDDSMTLEAIQTYYEMEQELQAFKDNIPAEYNYTPDIEWIEDFIHRAYTSDTETHVKGKEVFIVTKPNGDFAMGGGSSTPSRVHAYEDMETANRAKNRIGSGGNRVDRYVRAYKND